MTDPRLTVEPQILREDLDPRTFARQSYSLADCDRLLAAERKACAAIVQTLIDNKAEYTDPRYGWDWIKTAILGRTATAVELLEEK